MASKMIIRAFLAIVILSAVGIYLRQRALEVANDFQKPTEKQPAVSWQKCQEEIGLNPVTIQAYELPQEKFCREGEDLCECAKRNAKRIKANRDRVTDCEWHYGKNKNCRLYDTVCYREVDGQTQLADCRKKGKDVQKSIFAYSSGDEAAANYCDCLRDDGKVVVDSLEKEVNERISQAKTCEKNAATLLVGRARCQWKNFIGRENRQNKMNDANLFCKCLELEVGPQKAFLVRASYLKDNTGKHGRKRTNGAYVPLLPAPRPAASTGSAGD